MLNLTPDVSQGKFQVKFHVEIHNFWRHCPQPTLDFQSEAMDTGSFGSYFLFLYELQLPVQLRGRKFKAKLLTLEVGDDTISGTTLNLN